MTNILRILRRALAGLLKEDSGQMLPIVALMLASLMGMSGMAVDVGRLMYTRHQLQASTDAAALAGAAQLPNSTAATVATQYSSVSGNLNAQTGLTGVSMVSGYPQVACYASLQNQGMACVSPANGNAVVVKQQVSLNLFFLRVLGMTTMTVQASSTAAMRGATAAPYNVAIILDTTQSMNDKDSDSNCNSTRISCAEQGVQILLQSLSPLPRQPLHLRHDHQQQRTQPGGCRQSLTPSPASPAQRRRHTTTTAAPRPAPPSPNTPTRLTPTYQIVSFSSDYKSSDSASSLSTTSNLVKAVNGVSGCSGMQAVGGVGTYIAGTLYKAQGGPHRAAKSKPGHQERHHPALRWRRKRHLGQHAQRLDQDRHLRLHHRPVRPGRLGRPGRHQGRHQRLRRRLRSREQRLLNGLARSHALSDHAAGRLSLPVLLLRLHRLRRLQQLRLRSPVHHRAQPDLHPHRRRSHRRTPHPGLPRRQHAEPMLNDLS